MVSVSPLLDDRLIFFRSVRASWLCRSGPDRDPYPAMESSICRSGLPKALPAVAGHTVNRDSDLEYPTGLRIPTLSNSHHLLMTFISPCWATSFLFACPKRKEAKRKGTPHHCRRLIAADPLRAAQPARALRNSLRSNSPRAIPVLPVPCSAALRGNGLGSKRVVMAVTLLVGRYLSKRGNYSPCLLGLVKCLHL